MDYQGLIMTSLWEIGVDPEQVELIKSGAPIYGEAGLLDSVHLVSLIVVLEDTLTKAFDTPVNLFSERGDELLDEFKDVTTLASFLERCGHTCRSSNDRLVEVKSDYE
jgi:hypothetical protein